MQYVWIRRGYGCFVRCKNFKKAKEKAAHWYTFGQGDKGGEKVEGHEVIGLFTNKVNSPYQAERVELYNKNGRTKYV